MKQTILVVDDEPHILKTIADLLMSEGFSVLVAVDGKEGLLAAREKQPDLILLDVMMPKLDGFQVLKRLKKDPLTLDIPVIMLTVRGASKDVQEGIQFYAEKYITKPFDPERLLHEIKHSLMARPTKA
jgi:DNA-binding response OmpR family regulator